MDTKKKHQEQIEAALNWLAKTKFSSAGLLQEAAGRNRRGFVTQLKKLGLCVSRPMSGNVTIVGLSEKGAQLAGVKKFDIHKVSDRSVNHHLTAQRELLWMVKNGYAAFDYEFEPQLCANDIRPDIQLTLTNGFAHNVEIEISEKHIVRGEMDRFFSKISTYPTDVVFKSPRMMLLYIRHAIRYFKEGIPVWEKQNGVWCKTGRIECPSEFDWAKACFRLHLDDKEIQLADLMIEVTLGKPLSSIKDLDGLNPNELGV